MSYNSFLHHSVFHHLVMLRQISYLFLVMLLKSITDGETRRTDKAMTMLHFPVPMYSNLLTIFVKPTFACSLSLPKRSRR